MMDRGKGHLRVGRLLLSWPVHQGPRSALVDGCTTNLDRHTDDGELIERTRFGGVALRPPWTDDALAVTWRGARMPNAARWFRWAFVRARVRWWLAGRPPAVPMTPSGHDFVSEAEHG